MKIRNGNLPIVFKSKYRKKKKKHKRCTSFTRGEIWMLSKLRRLRRWSIMPHPFSLRLLTLFFLLGNHRRVAPVTIIASEHKNKKSLYARKKFIFTTKSITYLHPFTVRYQVDLSISRNYLGTSSRGIKSGTLHTRTYATWHKY